MTGIKGLLAAPLACALALPAAAESRHTIGEICAGDCV